MVGLIYDEAEISAETNVVTADLLAKLGAWTYASYYRGLEPKHDANNTYTFNGMQYKVHTTSTDASSGAPGTVSVTNDYKLPTRN